MAHIICGFSGIGKSTAEQRNRMVTDCESSYWSHIWDNGIEKGRNPQFPNNYINHIEEMMGLNPANYFLLSCHESVRNELKSRGLPYIIVMPSAESKNEYLKRWLRRGSPMEFIELMNDRWDEMIASCEADDAPKIYLAEYEYISDLICL